MTTSSATTTRTSVLLVRSTTSTTSTGSGVVGDEPRRRARRDGRVGLWRRYRGAVVACVHARHGGRLTSLDEPLLRGRDERSAGHHGTDASRYDYRADGRVARITNVDGARTTYDARGLVQTQTIEQGGTGESGTHAYGYDEVGRNISLTFADGHVRTQRYDDLGASSSVATRTRPDRGSPITARRELRRGGQRGVALRSGDGDHRGRRPDRVKTVTL